MSKRTFNNLAISLIASLMLVQSSYAGTKTIYMWQEYTGKEDDDTAKAAVFSFDGKASTQLVENAIYPQVSSDGNSIVYSEKQGEGYAIVLKNLSTGLIEQWAAPAFNLMADLSGNGRYLAFSGPYGPEFTGRDGKVTKENKIAIIDLWTARGSSTHGIVDGRHIYADAPEIVPSEGKSYFPELSSDGRFVVFHQSFAAPTTTSSKSATNKKITIYDRQEKKSKDLTPADGYCFEPTISMDDRYIAYVCRNVGEDQKNNEDIYVADRLHLDAKPVRVTTDAGRDYTPTFLPNNDLVFSSDRGMRDKEFQLHKATRNKDGSYTEVGAYVKAQGVLYNPSFSGDIELTQAIGNMKLIDGRSSFGIANMNGSPIVIGGNKGNQHDHSINAIVNSAEVLKKDVWCSDQSLCRPTPSQGFEAFYYNNKVLAVGGMTPETESENSKSLNYADVYDVKNQTWGKPIPLNDRRSSYAGSQIGKNAYLLYGWSTDGNFGGNYVNKGEVLDLENMHTKSFDLPPPYRRGLSSVVWKDKIILVGGFGSEEYKNDEGKTKTRPVLMNNVDIFNPGAIDTKEVITHLPSLPFGAFSPTAAVVGDTLYAFGGVYPYGPSMHTDALYVGHVYRLNLRNPSEGWVHTGRYMHEPKAFLRSLPDNNGKTVYLLGGHSFELYREANTPVTTQEIWNLVDYSKPTLANRK